MTASGTQKGNTLSLVTGGGGFVGRRVVARLRERGYPVRVLGRSPYPDLEKLGVETVQADLADGAAVERACRGVGVVHHVGACVGLWRSAAELTRTNVEGTRNVVAACVRGGVESLVFTSSASVVFDDADQEGVDESAPYPRRSTSPYAASKALAERLVLEGNGRGALRTIALRPHLVWGPGDPHFIPGFLELARRGRLIQVGDGRNRVDITYVDNLADAHLLAADRLGDGSSFEAAGRPFFVSQGEPVEIWTFFGNLLDRLGFPRPKRAISYRRAYALGAVGEILWRLLGREGAPPMTRFLAGQMAKSHFFDISAARRVLGFEPRVSTAAGVEILLNGLGVTA
jgi:nucleoside-diphosphate-sugar epimerase